ncbi:MAG: glycosyltransferase family 2 protein [Ginsengibacter sp.]
MKNPGTKITIITVCRNSEKFLEETIKSVINQTYANIEYIIIDGASTDSTLDIIRRYSKDIHSWLSGPDNSMYAALNKGLRLATGDFILILNSDDLLANNNTIEKAINLIDKHDPDYFYGNLLKFKDGETKKVKLFPVTFKQLLLSTHCTFVPHPCFFISKKLNRQLKGYDLKYQYASDYDYILKALATKGSMGKYINVDISKFRIHGDSITASGKINAERKKVLRKHGFYQYSLFSRLFFYYSLWIYYKIINVGNRYQAAKI